MSYAGIERQSSNLLHLHVVGRLQRKRTADKCQMCAFAHVAWQCAIRRRLMHGMFETHVRYVSTDKRDARSCINRSLPMYVLYTGALTRCRSHVVMLMQNWNANHQTFCTRSRKAAPEEGNEAAPEVCPLMCSRVACRGGKVGDWWV